MTQYNKDMKLDEACLLKNHIYSTIQCHLDYYGKKPLSQNSIGEDGTITISEPGYYYLIENIVFDIPSSMSIQDYLFTKPEDSTKIFGNHAGIIIESDCVILDLCGFTISQSARFYAAQRFFNLIQFNNFPFIKNANKSCQHINGKSMCPVVGPIPNVLIEEFHTPKYVVVRNGCLGLTSHTGIHGNDNSYIVIENMTAKDFEVSMVTLNKAEQVVIDCVNIKNSLSVVAFKPFLVTVMLAIKSFLSVGLTLPDLSVLHLGLKPLVDRIDLAVTIDDLVNIAKDFPDFDNSINKYLSPCGQYGISVTRKGPSVHNFSDDLPKETHSSECIFIVNTNIKNIHVNVFEDISIAKNGKPIPIIAGSVMRVVTMENPYTLEILRLLKTLPMEIRKTISGLDDQTIDLAINPDKNNPLELCRGIDNMAHTSKGIIAIRLDDCVHASVVNVNISNLSNIGKPLSPEEIQAAKEKYYSETIIMMDSTLLSPNEYVGNNACGIIASSGKNITILSSCIEKITSIFGCAIAIGLNNKVDCSFIECITIKDIDSNDNRNDSTTILIDEDCIKVLLNMITIN